MHSLDPSEDLAIVLLRRFLRLCEHPRTRQRMIRMVRQSTQPGPDGPRLYGWINRTLQHPRFQPLVERRGMSAMKAELVGAQLIGLAMVRYVLRLEPMASAPVEEVVRLAAPALRAALQGEDALSTAVTGPATAADRADVRRRIVRARRLPGAGAARRTAARGRGLA
jgi:hypothetical protein